MPMKTNNLVACPECDALQREVALVPGGVAACCRCGAELFRFKPDTLDRTLSWILTATVVFVAANSFPLLELEAQGIRTSTTLLGTVLGLQETGWPVLALLVLLSVIVIPFLQLAVSLALLVPAPALPRQHRAHLGVPARGRDPVRARQRAAGDREQHAFR